mgnify:CR=1 FL=1
MCVRLKRILMTFPTSRIIKTFIHVLKAPTNTRNEITWNVCGVTFEKLCKHEKNTHFSWINIQHFLWWVTSEWVSEGRLYGEKLIYFVVVVICLCELKIVWLGSEWTKGCRRDQTRIFLKYGQSLSYFRWISSY